MSNTIYKVVFNISKSVGIKSSIIQNIYKQQINVYCTNVKEKMVSGAHYPIMETDNRISKMGYINGR